MIKHKELVKDIRWTAHLEITGLSGPEGRNARFEYTRETIRHRWDTLGRRGTRTHLRDKTWREVENKIQQNFKIRWETLNDPDWHLTILDPDKTFTLKLPPHTCFMDSAQELSMPVDILFCRMLNILYIKKINIKPSKHWSHEMFISDQNVYI